MDVDLKCHLLHHNDVYMKLGPFKIEEASKSPYIAVMYDMMYDNEMDHFKSFASDKLKRSDHIVKNGFGTSFSRTSKQSWLSYKSFKPMSNLTEEEKIQVNRIKGQVRVPEFSLPRNVTESVLGVIPNDEVGWKVVSRLALASSLVTWKPMGSEDVRRRLL